MTDEKRIEAAAIALCGELWDVIPWTDIAEETRDIYRRIATKVIAAYEEEK
jgi:hypothetical protein